MHILCMYVKADFAAVAVVYLLAQCIMVNITWLMIIGCTILFAIRCGIL